MSNYCAETVISRISDNTKYLREISAKLLPYKYSDPFDAARDLLRYFCEKCEGLEKPRLRQYE